MRPRDVPRTELGQHWVLYSDAYMDVETRRCGIGGVLIGPGVVEWFGQEEESVDAWNLRSSVQPSLSLELLA